MPDEVQALRIEIARLKAENQELKHHARNATSGMELEYRHMKAAMVGLKRHMTRMEEGMQLEQPELTVKKSPRWRRWFRGDV